MIVHRGQPVKVSVRTPSHGCLPRRSALRGRRPAGPGIKHAHDGLVTWTVRVPNNAALGQARWTVRCGVTWQRTGTWLVKPRGRDDTGDSTPHVMVDKQGYLAAPRQATARAARSATACCSKNTSTTQDATRRLPADQLRHRKRRADRHGDEERRARSPRAASFAFGDSLQLRTQTPVSNLEVTIKVSRHEPAKPRILPHFVNVRSCRARPTPAGSARSTVRSSTTRRPRPRRGEALDRAARRDRQDRRRRHRDDVLAPAVRARAWSSWRAGFTAVPVRRAVTAIISVEPTYTTHA